MPEESIEEAAALAVDAVGDDNPSPVDNDSLRNLIQRAFDGTPPAVHMLFG